MVPRVRGLALKLSSQKKTHDVLQSILALVFFAAAIANLAGAMGSDMQRLGYPAYFSVILGLAYAIGVVCLYQRRFVFLQEWAIGAFAASLVGAAGSHVFAGDPFARALPALILQIFLVWFYLLRRKIARSGTAPETADNPTIAEAIG